MAIFHLNAKVIGIGQGKKSAISAAAYRSGEKLHDELVNKNFMYKRDDVSDSFIVLPEHVPKEFSNRQHLWTEAQKAELVKDGSRYKDKAVLAREIDLALQTELSPEDNKKVLKEFVQKNFTSKNLIADVCIHGMDGDNPHAHIMFTTRPIDENGKFGNKDRSLEPHRGKESFLQSMRETWSGLVNRLFKEREIDKEITHESYKAQGINQEPTKHLPYRREMSNPQYIERYSHNEKVKDLNNKREALVSEKKDSKSKIAFLRKEMIKVDITQEKKLKQSQSSDKNQSKDLKAQREGANSRKEKLVRELRESEQLVHSARGKFFEEARSGGNSRASKQEYQKQKLNFKMVKKEVEKTKQKFVKINREINRENARSRDNNMENGKERER